MVYLTRSPKNTSLAEKGITAENKFSFMLPFRRGKAVIALCNEITSFTLKKLFLQSIVFVRPLAPIFCLYRWIELDGRKLLFFGKISTS
jgi:hypothetical protein